MATRAREQKLLAEIRRLPKGNAARELVMPDLSHLHEGGRETGGQNAGPVEQLKLEDDAA